MISFPSSLQKQAFSITYTTAFDIYAYKYNLVNIEKVKMYKHVKTEFLFLSTLTPQVLFITSFSFFSHLIHGATAGLNNNN